jgi:hypothetical protein
MRKTLAVLVLVISSMLLLQAPAWAPTASTVEPDHHLYKIKTANSYEALTDCPSSSIVIRPNPSAKAVRATKEQGKKKFYSIRRNETLELNRFIFKTDDRFSPTKLRARCDNELMYIEPDVLGPEVPFTGVSLVPQLLLGVGLLLVGTVLLGLTGRLPVGRLRRRRAGSATPS